MYFFPITYHIPFLSKTCLIIPPPHLHTRSSFSNDWSKVVLLLYLFCLRRPVVPYVTFVCYCMFFYSFFSPLEKVILYDCSISLVPSLISFYYLWTLTGMLTSVIVSSNSFYTFVKASQHIRIDPSLRLLADNCFFYVWTSNASLRAIDSIVGKLVRQEF